MAYKGKFTPVNKSKYGGDHTGIVYRSLWERNVMRWLDNNPDINVWVSEEIVIPYVCKTDKRVHRYFIDVYFETNAGRKVLVEIKPDRETRPPTAPKRRSQRYLREAMTFIKNQSKWEAAESFALDNGCEFVVWTEKTLKSLGIKLN